MSAPRSHPPPPLAQKVASVAAPWLSPKLSAPEPAGPGTKTVTGELLSALLFVVVNKKDIMHRHISVARVLLQGTGGPLRDAGPLGASRGPSLPSLPPSR